MIEDENLGWRLGASGGTAALLLAGRVHPLPGTSVGQLLADWDRAVERLDRLCRGDPPMCEEGAAWGAPHRPGAVFCAGANYVDHVLEMTGRPPPAKAGSEPFFFLKPPGQCVVGPDAAVRLPHPGCQLDWEAEIAVVIGREVEGPLGHANALAAVAGYAIVNDLSARDRMKRDDVPFTYDWIGQKCFPGALPYGPWITPAALIADPHDLWIRLTVGEETMQDSSSRQMHWSIPEQLDYLSRRVGLRVGDLVCTGTPAGCGRPRGRYLAAGETSVATIEGLGALTTHFLPPLPQRHTG